MWTNNGTITVTTGSRIVEGQGTQFVGPVIAGYALLTGDLRLYEIEAVESATRLRLVRPYQGGGAANVPYDVVPISPDVTGLVDRIQALIDRYQSFRDTVGQGLFPDGTMAAPAFRFLADQDTGFARYGPNLLSAVAGGVERMRVGEVNSSLAPLVATAGVTCQQSGVAGSLVLPLDIVGALGGAATMRIRFGSAANQFQYHSFIEAQTLTGSASDLRFGTSGVEQARIDNAGNFLIGVASGARHTIARASSEGDDILYVRNTAGQVSAVFQAVGAGGWQGPAALLLGKNSVNGRSVGAAGTVNASGADYAEYMIKAAGCGIIAKGDVCGVDCEGRLTKTWADAISFVVKSTDPSLVGGDTWAAHLRPRPEAPDAEPQSPVLPTVPAEDADDAELATYRDALAAYPVLVAQYRTDHDGWAAATAAYERDLPAWEAELEAARICVDRIAFCGQVPCNVTGDCEVGDYIVAAANGAGIRAIAVKADDMTLAQYMRRIGKVWAIRDGRAWIDVQHG